MLVFINHDSRFLRIAGVTAKPVSDWVTQQARNLSISAPIDDVDPAKLRRTDRLGGLIREHRMVA